jgi:hypothetical protein
MSDMPSVDATANWEPDVNRFGLPKPPAWFLKMLWDQDAALVVLPSRQGRKYIVARRRSLSKNVNQIVQTLLADAMKKHKAVRYLDSEMLESRKLVVVDAITSMTGNLHDAGWMASAPGMLGELRSRDMWTAGGVDKFLENLEAREAKQAAKQRQSLLDDIDHRAGDAWRSYQARTGARNQHANSGAKAKILPVGTL